MFDMEEIMRIENSRQREFVKDYVILGVKILDQKLQKTDFKILLKYTPFIAVFSKDENEELDVENTIALRDKFEQCVLGLNPDFTDPDALGRELMIYREHIQDYEVDVSEEQKFDIEKF